eukprot:1385243-Amphidinium_carterae.1
MTSYMQRLYNLDKPLTHGLETLASLQLHHPQTIGRLHRAWKSVKQWKRTQPLSVRAPLPLSVVLAMATAAWAQGWQRTACLLPGEAAAGLRSHLILPCDLAGTRDNALFVIPDSKTAARTVQVQSVIVFDTPLVDLLMHVFHADSDRTPLMPGGLTQFTKRFYQLKDMLGISASPWSPASLRGGGAVEFARSSYNIPYLQWKGRWSNPRTMVHYLQTSLGAQSYAKVDPRAQDRIVALARLAPEILSPLQHPPLAIAATRTGLTGDGREPENSPTYHHNDISLSFRGNGKMESCKPCQESQQPCRAHIIVCAGIVFDRSALVALRLGDARLIFIRTPLGCQCYQ